MILSGRISGYRHFYTNISRYPLLKRITGNLGKIIVTHEKIFANQTEGNMIWVLLILGLFSALVFLAAVRVGAASQKQMVDRLPDCYSVSFLNYPGEILMSDTNIQR